MTIHFVVRDANKTILMATTNRVVAMDYAILESLNEPARELSVVAMVPVMLGKQQLFVAGSMGIVRRGEVVESETLEETVALADLRWRRYVALLDTKDMTP